MINNRKINLLTNNIFPKVKKHKYIFIGIAVFLLLFAVYKSLNRKSAAVSVSGDTRADIQLAKASMDINREFLFPLEDNKGKELTKIKYFIEKAELRDEIIVKGQRAVAVKGKTFLIISIRVTNTYEKPIQINTRDYLRLSLNGNMNDLLAANIHNDPITIQAISAQPVRLGFAVSDTDSNLKLLIGEIKGNKEEIQLDLK